VLLFLFVVIVISFSEKKKQTEFLLAAVLFITAAVLFKRDFLVELGINLLFHEGKRRSKQD
jgi:predicted branched-subunit amino acid permease